MTGRSIEKGFTLIELLVVISIIGVLAATFTKSVAQYRKKAYYSVSQETVGFAKAALEGGKINSDSFSGTKWAYSNASSSFTGQPDEIAPGLKARSDLYQYVYHNPACATDWCIEDYIIVRHCKSTERIVYYRYKNGYEAQFGHVFSTVGC